MGVEIIKHQVCEVRFDALPELLDIRGILIRYLKEIFKLDAWSMSNDGFKVNSKDGKVEVFMTIQRCGIHVKTHDEETFRNLVMEFLKFVFTFEQFPDSFKVKRIGIRNRQAFSYEGSFEEIISKFKNNYICVNDKVLEELNMEMTDIGGPIIFKDGLNTINTNCGPMKDLQLKEFFESYDYIENWPEVSLYVDVDYYCAAKEKLELENVVKKAEEFSFSAEEKLIAIKDLVLR